MREITCINYVITTKCDRLCPDCCCNMPNRQGYDVSWEYIKQSAKYFKGINRISLSGGEPTLHPQFEEFVPKLKDLFQCKLLTLETNGYGFKKFPDVFKHFDWIQISHYSEASYEGSWDNKEDIEFIKQYLPSTTFLIGEILHVNKNVITGGKICDRGLSETASYQEGLLYPCCVSPGVIGAKGIVLTESWKEKILNVTLPCINCLFAN